MDQKQKTDFYREIDDHQIHVQRGCLKVGIFFALMAVIGGLIIYLIVAKFKYNAESINNLQETRGTDNATQIDASTGELVVTQGQINDFLDQNKALIPLQYAMAVITSENITLKGMWQGLNTRMEIVLVPRVANNVVVMDVKSVKIGSFSAPRWLGGQISNIVAKATTNQIKKDGRKTVKTVKTDTEKIIIGY